MIITKEAFDAKLLEIKKAYYSGNPVMSDHEYDKLLDKYKELFHTEETVGAPLDDIPDSDKVKHKFPSLSLDKTKDITKFSKLFSVHNNDTDKAVVMYKLDGSTIQLTYYKGKLYNAATRGDGYIGQNITKNASVINGIPQPIAEQGLVTVRGEATMSLPDFNRINDKLPDDEKYENARNLASASLTLHDIDVLKDRNITFNAFNLVFHPDMCTMSFSDRLDWCSDNGFNTVEYTVVETSLLEITMKMWSEHAPNLRYLTDGLVVAYEDAPYADTLGGTEHHPNPLRGYAFKWKDEEVETEFLEFIWQTTRTGLINPKGRYTPKRLEGTTVEYATLHNLSYIKKLHLRIGDKISVYKANKIIPKIAENLSTNTQPYTQEEKELYLRPNCPVCGASSEVHISDEGVETLYCSNPYCQAKLLDTLKHFCSRQCMNIEGLSEATLKTFMYYGWVQEFSDIYKLEDKKISIIDLDGFGETSYNNLVKSINKSKNTNFVSFITAMGIPGISIGQAKKLKEHFQTVDNLFSNINYDFTQIDSFGEVLSNSLSNWLHTNIGVDKSVDSVVTRLLPYLTFVDNVDNSVNNSNLPLYGKTFVVTGKVLHFNNRDDIHAYIEKYGGKTSGSVSNKTSYLINNDVTSTSGKNEKAHELGIPIISEEDLIKIVGSANTNV